MIAFADATQTHTHARTRTLASTVSHYRFILWATTTDDAADTRRISACALQAHCRNSHASAGAINPHRVAPQTATKTLSSDGPNTYTQMWQRTLG